MKIKFLRKATINGFTHEKGSFLEVIRQLGKDLIYQGIAIEAGFDSMRDIHALKAGIDQDKDQEIPFGTEDLIKWISSCSNKSVLDGLARDKRKLVKEAVAKRLQQI